MGWIALGAAVLGFLFACIPGALIIGWLLLPVGFILSIVAFFLKGAKWPAIVGLIVSVVGTIVGFIVFFAVVLAAAHNAFSSTSSGATVAPQATQTIAATSAAGSAAPADSEFPVTIDSGTQTTDYSGAPAVVVTYTFTNNSTKDANFLTTLSAKAFQNGVELETAVVENADIASSLADVKPGATTSVQEAYSLTDGSPVTVEVKKLFDFSDAVLATSTITLQ